MRDVALALALAGALACQAAPAAEESAILTERAQPGGWNIFLVSPDGTRIAFEGRSRQYGVDNSDIFVMNADGTGLVNLTDVPDDHEIDPTWSADGRRIGFVTYDPTNANLDILQVDVPSGFVSPFSTVSFDERHPAWTTVP